MSDFPNTLTDHMPPLKGISPDLIADAGQHRPISPPRNFAELSALAASWDDIPPPRRSVLVSNIRTVALAAVTAAAHQRGELGVPNRKQIDLRSVPCDVPWLNKHVFGVTAKMLGIKGESTLGNAISGVRGALRRIGLVDAELPRVSATEGQWRNLLDAMLARGCLYAHGLATFGSWCHREGIAPADVTDATLRAYETYLRTRTLQGDIADRIRKVAKAMRVARLSVDVANGGVVKAPIRRVAYTQRVSTYSAGLKADIDKFVARISDKARNGPFRGDGPRKSLREASVAARVFSIRQAVAALVHGGRALESIMSLADLVEPVAFKSILLFYWNRAIDRRVAQGDFRSADDAPIEAGVTSMTGGIAKTLLIIARHHCGLAPDVLGVLRKMADDLTPPRKTEISCKNLARVRQFDNLKTRRDLLMLSSKLLGEAEKGGLSPHRCAVMARTGLAIEILLNAPLRLSNLVSLQFGNHLRTDGSKKGRYTHLFIPDHEMKNKRTYETVISPDLAAKIAHYQRLFHPSLAPSGSAFVFPAGRGRPGHIGASAMRSHIVSVIEKEIGVRVHPHLFRHLAARFTAEAGGSLEDGMQLVGDKDSGVFRSHYASVEAAEAARRHHERLRRGRRIAVVPPKPAAKKR